MPITAVPRLCRFFFFGLPNRNRPPRKNSVATLTGSFLYCCPACPSCFEKREEIAYHLEANCESEHVEDTDKDADNEGTIGEESDNVEDTTGEDNDNEEETTDDEDNDNGEHAFDDEDNDNGEHAFDEDDEDNDAIDEDKQHVHNATIITIPRVAPVPRLQKVTAKVGIERRLYNDAIMFACQQERDDQKLNSQTMRTVEGLDLEPFSIVNDNDEEINALAHPKVISKAVLGKNWVVDPTVVSKRKFDEVNVSCANCSEIQPNRQLESLISMSPFGNVLRTRKYVELGAELCELANRDWCFYPNLQY
ncbi:unnamed protein product [Absidia cylindrospora]